MPGHDYDQQFDVPQVACLAVGGGMFVDGMNAVLADGATARWYEFGIGGVFLLLAWCRNYQVVRRSVAPADPPFPAPTTDGGDRIVVWTTLLVALGVGLGALFDQRWYLGYAIAALVVALLLAMRLLLRSKFSGSHQPENYVLPIVAIIGPTRAMFFILGVIGIVRGLFGISDASGADNLAEISVVIVGLLLVLLSVLEQGAIGRTRSRRAVAPAEPAALAAVTALLATLAKGPAATAPATSSGKTPAQTAAHASPRPIWLVSLVTAALLGFGGFFAWEALRRSDGAQVGTPPLVLAGLAFVLGTVGERLANLTFKFGTMEATVVTEGGADEHGAAPEQQGAAGAAGAGGAAGAAGAANVVEPNPVDLDSADAVLIASPQGETVGDSLRAVLKGSPRRLMYSAEHVAPALSSGRQIRILGEPAAPPAPPPPAKRTITLKGPSEDVASLLATVFDN